MPIQRISTLNEAYIEVFNASAGSQTGSKVTAVSPIRGQLIVAGFAYNSLCASATTLAVSIGANFSPTASSFTQVITSTLGTFGSTLTIEGGVCSVIPPSPAYVNAGDAIQWVTSGGNTSAIGATIDRRAAGHGEPQCFYVQRHVILDAPSCVTQPLRIDQQHTGPLDCAFHAGDQREP